MASNTPAGQALRRHLRDTERLNKSSDRGVTKTSLERKIAAAEKAGNVPQWKALRAKQKLRDDPKAAITRSKTAARKARKDLVKRGLVVHKPGTLPLTASYQPMYDVFLDFLHEAKKDWLGTVTPATKAFRKFANKFKLPVKIPGVKGRANPIDKESKLRDEEKNDAPSITGGMSESIYNRMCSRIEAEGRNIKVPSPKDRFERCVQDIKNEK